MTNLFDEPYRVLTRVYRDGAHLKIALAEARLGEKTRAGTVKTVYGVLERDAYLSLCIDTFAEKPPKAAVKLIIKIALCYLLFQEKPRPLVTDAAVSYLKEIGKGGASGFVNAFLRNFDAAKVELPAGDAGLAVESNYPAFALKMLRAAYGDRARDIALAKSRGVSVRFARNMEQYLGREHIDTPFKALKIFKNFAREEGFDRGDYTFQSVGSVAICDAVEPCENLLDACAAPGGKSVLLAEKCARVTACDLHPHRVSLIESYARRMGAGNVNAMQKDATVFDPAWESSFDGVLCDVPCSGLGTLAENPDLSLFKREEDLAGLKETQLAVLNNCARYVKRGGCLYYSTCSVLPCENDGVVQAFLRGEAAFSAEPVLSPLEHEKTAYGVQFLPDTAFGAGFYVCKMRRL